MGCWKYPLLHRHQTWTKVYEKNTQSEILWLPSIVHLTIDPVLRLIVQHYHDLYSTESSTRRIKHRHTKRKNNRRHNSNDTYEIFLLQYIHCTSNEGIANSDSYFWTDSIVGELPTSWFPQTHTKGIDESTLLNIFLKSAICFGSKTEVSSPKTELNR